MLATAKGLAALGSNCAMSLVPQKLKRILLPVTSTFVGSKTLSILNFNFLLKTNIIE